jgi:hypothetical protein
MEAEEILSRLQCLLGFCAFICLTFQSQSLVDFTLRFVITDSPWVILDAQQKDLSPPHYSVQRGMKFARSSSHTERK